MVQHISLWNISYFSPIMNSLSATRKQRSATVTSRSISPSFVVVFCFLVATFLIAFLIIRWFRRLVAVAVGSHICVLDDVKWLVTEFVRRIERRVLGIIRWLMCPVLRAVSSSGPWWLCLFIISNRVKSNTTFVWYTIFIDLGVHVSIL